MPIERIDAVGPAVIDIDVFLMIELVEARVRRVLESGGYRFEGYEAACILSN